MFRTSLARFSRSGSFRATAKARYIPAISQKAGRTFSFHESGARLMFWGLHPSCASRDAKSNYVYLKGREFFPTMPIDRPEEAKQKRSE